MGELNNDELAYVVNDFVREMQMLSKLRHPNLLLFLGVAYDEVSHFPAWIVTELMTKSLYNVVHDDKIVLTLPQVISVTLDISKGLQYLHQQSNPIIHRDISSKNILLDGSRCVISDLGQAKVLSSTLTRATSMPGAYKLDKKVENIQPH